MNLFSEILEILSKHLDMRLEPDTDSTCVLLINETFEVHIELFSDEHILFASFLYDIPPGKFREEVMMEALKANSLFPSYVTFAYNELNNHLTLFQLLPIRDITGEILSLHAGQFIEIATEWIESIKQGRLPPSSFLGEYEKGMIFPKLKG